MNILHLNTLDTVGGAAKNAYRIHKACRRHGHNSAMLVGYLTTQAQGIFELKRGKPNRWQRWLGLDGFFGQSDIPDHPLVRQADLIHLHNLHGNFFNLKALIRLSAQKPVIWTLNDMWPITGHCAHSFKCQRWQTGCGQCPYLDTYPALRFDLTRWLLSRKRSIYRHSKLTLVVPSQWLHKKIEKSILKGKRCEVIPHGINENIFKPLDKNRSRKALKLPQETTIVCFAAHGGLDNFWKGGAYFTKIVKFFRTKKNVLFMEIGGDGKMPELQGNLLRIPQVRNEHTMVQYYSAADVLLCTSLAENSPLVILEAMACGLPVVSFDIGGVKELVIHQKTGWIGAYKNVKDLQRGLQKLLISHTLSQNFGQQARQRFQEFFTLKKQVQRHFSLYQELVENSQRP